MPFEFLERPALYNLSPLERFNLIKEKQSLRKEKYFKLKRAQYVLHKDQNKEILNRIYENVKNYEKNAINRKPLLLTNGKRHTITNEDKLPSNKRLKKLAKLTPDSTNSSFAFSVNFNYDDIIDEENKKASENNMANDIFRGKYTASNSSSDITMAGTSTIGKIEPLMKILPSNGFTFAKRDLSNLVQAKEDLQSRSTNISLIPHRDITVTSKALSTTVENSTVKPTLFLTEAIATATDLEKPAFLIGSSLSDNKIPIIDDTKNGGSKIESSSSKPIFNTAKSQFSSYNSSSVANNKFEEKPKPMSFSFGAVSSNTNSEKNKKRSRDSEEGEKAGGEKKTPLASNFKTSSNSSTVPHTENGKENSSEQAKISFSLKKKDENVSEKPLFSFGAVKTLEQGNQSHKEQKETSKPLFAFTSFGKQSETNSEVEKSEKIVPTNFSFGASKTNESDINSGKPAFTFGSSKSLDTNKKEETKESNATTFAFGSNKNTFEIGGLSNKDDTGKEGSNNLKKPASFGSVPSKENASTAATFSISSSSEPGNTGSGFVFGSLNKNEKSVSLPSTTNGLTFGKNPTSSEPSTGLTKLKTDSNKPLFSFGSQKPPPNGASLFGATSDISTSKATEKPKFSFNTPGDEAKDSSASKTQGFTFGNLAAGTTTSASNNVAPKFAFGQTTATPLGSGTLDATKPTFSFGGSSSNPTALSSQSGTTKSNSIFSFSSNKEDPKKTKLFSSLGGSSTGNLFGGNNTTSKKLESGSSGFAFNSNALNKKETTPSTSFNFGALNASSNNTGFNFGNENATNGTMFYKKPDTQSANVFGNSSNSNSGFNVGTGSSNNNNGSSRFTFGNNGNNNTNNGTTGFTFGSNNNNNGFTFSASSSRSTTPAANFGTASNPNANTNLFGNNNNVFGNSSSPAPAGPFGAVNNNTGFGKSTSPAPMGSGFGLQNNGSAGGFEGNNGSNNNSFNFGNNSANNGSGGFNFGASANNNNGAVSFTFTGAGSNNSASIDPSSIFNNGQQASGEAINGRKLLVPKRRTRR